MVITTQEPQEKMILLHISARKVQAPEHSTPVSLVCGRELKHNLRDALSQCHFSLEGLFERPLKTNYWKMLLMNILILTN